MRTPRSQSIQIACAPPIGWSAGMRRWPRASSPGPSGRRQCRLRLDQGRAGHGEQTRQRHGALQVHAVVGDLGDEVRLAHGLEMAAHDPEGHRDAVPVRHHAGDDRVH